MYSSHVQDTITRLLHSIGTKREVGRYLRVFSSPSPSRPAKFAVIEVDGAVLDNVDELAINLRCFFGLYPVVLHGAGYQLNSIIETTSRGIRVTGAYLITSSFPNRNASLPKVQTPTRHVFLNENLKRRDGPPLHAYRTDMTCRASRR